jgi:NAD(P)-dependent dehydrogenase (short-subunit alcohol dehydrogenase family)
MRLEGKGAVVTGASSGIGRTIAEVFAAEGARVVAVDRNPAVVTDPPRDVVFSVVCDVSQTSQVDGLGGQAQHALGHLDILVNAAGVVVFGTTADGSEEDWDRAFAVNIKGVWLMCRMALPRMVASGQGAIVNIASATGLRVVAGLAAYSASKAAVISLTRSIALEYGNRGVRANCLCPGRIDTPMNDLARECRVAHGQRPEDEFSGYAIPRLGRPDEVASAALYLASSESSYITGATLPVDAGRSLH